MTTAGNFASDCFVALDGLGLPRLPTACLVHDVAARQLKVHASQLGLALLEALEGRVQHLRMASSAHCNCDRIAASCRRLCCTCSLARKSSGFGTAIGAFVGVARAGPKLPLACRVLISEDHMGTGLLPMMYMPCAWHETAAHWRKPH